MLPAYLPRCRWFAAKARRLARIYLELVLPLPLASTALWMVRARFTDGGSQRYLLPVVCTDPSTDLPQQGRIAETPSAIMADACYDDRFRRFLFAAMCANEQLAYPQGRLLFQAGRNLRPNSAQLPMQSRLLAVEQSNTAMMFDLQPSGYFLKLYRRIQQLENPEVELTRYLTEEAGFTSIPTYAGAIYWKPASGQGSTLAILQGQIQAKTDLWTLWGNCLNEVPTDADLPALVQHQAVQLGVRTAAMHRALSAATHQPRLIPEPFHRAYCTLLAERCRRMLQETLLTLKKQNHLLSDSARHLAGWLTGQRLQAESLISGFASATLHSLRIRIHGDYHLGQIVTDGNDLTILDFEGEPDRSILQRRIKHSPLKDVAGMLRSFHYRLCAQILDAGQALHESAAISRTLQHRYERLCSLFLHAYKNSNPPEYLLSCPQEEFDQQLRFHLLEKAIYELRYELNSRPAWVPIPLQGMVSLL